MELLGNPNQAPASWLGSKYIMFNDGDIIDSLNLVNLENHHACSQDEPEWSLASGGKCQHTSKADFVSLGFNRNSKKLSLDISNAIDNLKSLDELASMFFWYFSINTKTNEVTVHYVENHNDIERLESITWQVLLRWLINYKPAMVVFDFRETVVVAS